MYNEEESNNSVEYITGTPPDTLIRTPTASPNQSNINLPKTPSESPPKFQPHTPLDSSPPDYEPQTPLDPPPPSVEPSDDLIENNKSEKEKQISKLRQTYVDVTKRKMNRQKNIFSPVIDTDRLLLPIFRVDKNVRETLKSMLVKKYEYKCNKHGLMKEDSLEVLTISSANVKGSNAEFHVTYQCLVCKPVEGMLLEASIVNVTKAGIRAELIGFKKSPLVIFIARDHHNNSEYFNSLKEKDVIAVKIIGIRYELNDDKISTIGELNRLQ